MVEETSIDVELVGNFEQDYLELCRRNEQTPFRLHKIVLPLPPLPTITNPSSVSASASNLSKLNSFNKSTRYESKYRFTPTIVVELNDNEEEEEVFKVEVRGYKLNIPNLSALSAAIPACLTITNLCIWNCGLKEQHFSMILSCCCNSNIRVLALDYNPEIPEICFQQLTSSDEVNIKSLSLRGNFITDIGCQGLANSLKTNRTLMNLNLFDNRIENEGAESLAEALKVNNVLLSLSLGKNRIGDNGAMAIAKSLCNYPLTTEEAFLRRKTLYEMEKTKHDQEDGEKKKGGRNQRTGSAKGAGDKDDKKRGQNKPAAGAGKKEPPRATKTPEDAKKKPDDKKAKEKAKSPVNIKGKKGKPEEVKDDIDENDIAIDIFELNGQQCIVGNRTLNYLNLCSNLLTNVGVKALLDMVMEQEQTSEQCPEGLLGIFRILLALNQIDYESPWYLQLNTLLNSRNPFFEAEQEIAADLEPETNSENGDALEENKE